MFKLVKRRLILFKQFYPILHDAKKNYIILFVCSIIATFIAYLNPEFYKIFINDVIIGKKIELISLVFGGYIFLFILRSVLAYVQFNVKTKFASVTLFSLKCKLLNSILRRSLSKDIYSFGEMKVRLEEDVRYLDLLIEEQTIDYVLSAVRVLLSSILLLLINPFLATYAIIIIPITIYLENIIGKKKGIYIEQMRENRQQSSDWLHKTISGWRTIKASNLQPKQVGEYQKYLNDYCESNRKWMNLWILSNRILPRLKDEFIMKISLYFLGGLLIGQGRLTIGALLVFITYYEMLRENINNFAIKDAQLLEALPHFERLSEEYEMSKSSISERSIDLQDSNKLELLLDDISFKYSEESEWLIEKLSLKLVEGDVVAITGKSGVGKSTLIKIIAGIELPSKGVVYFNGMDIGKVSVKFLYQNIGVVMQDSVLFNDTIAENLKFGQDISEENMVEVCRQVMILEDIYGFPKGFNTVVGENGKFLSGGQRQKIILARQLLRGTRVLILDEATSAIDLSSEKEIMNVLKKLSKEHIILIISHRQLMLSFCNKRIDFGDEGIIIS